VEKSPLTVRQAALDLLARREHAVDELRQKLKRRFAKAEVDFTLHQLAEEGLQSDHRFACAYVRERARRCYGPQRILSELLYRGIDERCAESALAITTEEEGIDWSALARRALERKFGAFSKPSAYPQRARYLRYLQYRGFGPDCLDGDPELG